MKPIVAIVVGAVIAIYAPQFLSTYMGIIKGTLGSAIATGALAGAAGGAIMTGTLDGTLKGAVFGALSAGVAYGIGHGGGLFAKVRQYGGAVGKAALHGISRAAISKLQTGSGKGGFLGGFAASLLGGVVNSVQTASTTVKVAMASIAGGTASVLGGGKFSNGAMSGAFIMMFNELAWDKAHDANINKIKQTALGRKMLRTLSKSSNEYYIKDAYGNGYSSKTKTIVLSSNAGAIISINDDNSFFNSFFNSFKQIEADNILFHELGHAYLDEIGNVNFSNEMYVIKNYENIYGGYNRVNHWGIPW